MKKTKHLSSKLTSIQEYPFILKKEADKMKIYCPDLDLSYDQLPIAQNLAPHQRPHYFQMLGIAILKAWQQGEAKKEDLSKANKKVPLPSSELTPSSHQTEKLLSPPEIARRKGCHRDTVRRAIDRGELEFIRTAGGHRRVPQTLAEKWIKAHKNRLKGRPKNERLI